MNTLKVTNEKKIVGTLALVAAIFILFAGISYVLVPYEQKLIIFSEDYFKSFQQNPLPYYGFWSGMFVKAMCMIGVVYFFHNLDSKLQSPLFIWISILSVIGYMLMGLTYISRLYYMPNVTQAYLNSSATTQETIVALGTMEFDKFIMSYGFSFIWFMAVSIYSIRYKLFNKLIVILSFIISLGYLVALLGYFIRTRVLTTGSSCLVILFPVWAYSIYKYTRQLK